MTYSLRSRALALSAATATLAIALVAAPAVTDTLPLQSADAATQFCFNAVNPQFGNLHTSATPNAVDGGVAVYSQGDFTMLTGAQETEGQFIVGGNANFFTHVYSNIGTVGVGSQVSPLPGSDVLVTGGNVTVGAGAPATTVQVSAGSSGDIVAGGTITVGGIDTLSYTSGSGTTGAATPLAPYSAFPADYTLMSSYFAAQAVTGTVTVGANDVTFAGDTTSALQVFSVSGTDLGSVGASKDFHFTGIPANAVVIVNVTGAVASISTQGYVQLNGSNLDWAPTYAVNPAFSNFNQSMMWNFPTATSVTFGDGSQIPGSITAPLADLTLLASTNGRVYAGGDITLGGGTQTGLEMHNYAFRGYNCSTPGTGSLSIAKAISDPDGVVDTNRAYDVGYSCIDTNALIVATGSVSLVAGAAAQVIPGLPVDAECSITEDPATLVAAPTTDDSSYVWDPPTYSASPVTITDGGTVSLTVTNHVERLTGQITITKQLTDPDGVVTPGRSFGGSYSCENAADVVVASGSWAAAAGVTDTLVGIPLGSTCTFTEDLSVAPSADPSYGWAAPVYSPSNAVVAVGGGVSIQVANVVTQGVGSFSISKSLIDPDGVATGRTFSGTWNCSDALGASVASGTWSLAHAASVTQSGIPIGSECSAVETAPAAPSATDPSYFWAPVVYSATSVTINSTTTPAITVTNEVQRSLGSLEVTKALTAPAGVVDPGRSYTGTVTCSIGTPSPNTWSVTAGGAPATFSGIPAGATCSVTEDALTVAPSSTDSSYLWQAVTYSVANVTIASGSTSSIEVRNSVRRALGHLELVKVLDDPFNVVSLSRVYTGTFQCLHNSVSVAAGPWSTTAGAPAITLATNLPAGTVCTAAEDASTLAAPPLAGFPQYIWRAPTVSPAVITIADGVTGRFTVTNTVYDPISLLAATGTDAAMPLLLGGGALAAGAIAVLLGYRRRRSA